jgi:dTDP-glucose 4,6-dehydratase
MILVTGAAGFIGLNYIKHIMLNVPFEQVDIADSVALELVFKKYKIDSVINFAAESHVDNSISDCMPFVYSNIIGTINLLQLSVKYSINKFLQISTDEVFGEVPEPGMFNEYSNITPRNPYSASKASAEHFVNAFNNTYGLNTLIVNCSNNYGPYQHKEKMIPKIIDNAINNKKIPVYGDGKQVRDWIYVEDAVTAIKTVFDNGKFGERYCISGMDEMTNIQLVKFILNELGKPHDLIEFVKDRPGHDTRYSTDSSKLIRELKWKPSWTLSHGIQEVIKWSKV